MQCGPLTLPVVLAVVAGALLGTGPARADEHDDTVIPSNKRLNDGVIANVYTAQRQAGCDHDVNSNSQLQLAAQRHVHDLMTNRALDGDIGSDGSSPQDRANAAGYQGKVAETVAINPALAISGMDILNQWYGNPAYKAIMSDCAYSQMGVWSENSLDRTVLVAVYGQASQPPSPLGWGQPSPIDPSPDYDASDEVEFGLNWFPWILRGVYPPPANPPQ